MATVPARRFRHAAREVAVALVIAGVGALATVGFAPAIALTRFEYTDPGAGARSAPSASSTGSARACTAWAVAA